MPVILLILNVRFIFRRCVLIQLIKYATLITLYSNKLLTRHLMNSEAKRKISQKQDTLHRFISNIFLLTPKFQAHFQCTSTSRMVERDNECIEHCCHLFLSCEIKIMELIKQKYHWQQKHTRIKKIAVKCILCLKSIHNQTYMLFQSVYILVTFEPIIKVVKIRVFKRVSVSAAVCWPS